MSPAIDHLVYATPDLQGTVAWLDDRGLRLSPGGPHVGLGTRNFLAGLGGATYLEVVGPDSEQPEPPRPRPFGIDELRAARLVTWAARVPRMAEAIAAARQAGYELSDPHPMSRRRPDGVLLEWELAFPPDGAGIVPFLIDWRESPHPSESLAGAATLESFSAEHPEPGVVVAPLRALGQSLEVTRGPEPKLEAVIRTASDEVVLR
ncbi:VOC family protein [Amycolatopsis acidicola]|uniref:VOC family protein n=1 Tax=Amycolatopsis acidicola TaxID=2596893 RepID=A0A5N0UWR7_9PSEU|nr:VOC family protein [Amycolatopsis acidicola]KAA9157212.1 VOC family protein [Amycolatopsis acidicola]